MQDNGEAVNQDSVLNKKSQNLENLTISKNLPKNVCLKLYDLMQKVVKDEVTPKTVSAACMCASEIQKILKLNYEMQKE